MDKPYILSIESATQVCSVALHRGNELVQLIETSESNAHSQRLTLFIQEILRKESITPKELNAVAVSAGPGSYTGLRIGVSAAKGLCYALNIPLIGISTLKAMAFGLASKYHQQPSYLFMPAIDARRMELYTAIYDHSLSLILKEGPLVVDEEWFNKQDSTKVLVLGGNGALKCLPLTQTLPNIKIIDDFTASASYVGALAIKEFSQENFVDVSYFEPHYMKEFVAAPPSVKGLK
ncbi:MAG TPA: tRNA (adenosine(37)-N6)-threonylcarbamoyltransferase complex dimerization subunit type 1 TsaB [Bacteroidales bacterium]|jgi:tRNA threonylcarbamoyladenosine biosynthesis protein TsaB|nr:tRNA (adenosine(37)-N6)-threonylcarbamoyltransferase complex dimerization subunit type 1 TsaB [Bacteroidales bacterium]